jgi:hypothetical protein
MDYKSQALGYAARNHRIQIFMRKVAGDPIGLY